MSLTTSHHACQVSNNYVQSLTNIQATAMFVWNIIQWLFTFIWDNAILAAVGVVDLGLAATLLTGVVFQSRFIPQSYSQCRNAASWKNGVDGRNFFAVFATAAGQNDKDPDSACRDFVRIWILAIVLVTLYIICGTINLLVGLAEKHILPPDPIVESRKKQPYRQPFQPTSWPDPPKNPYPRIYGYLMLYCLLSDALYYFWTTFRFGLRCLRKYLSFKTRSPPSFPVDDEEANAEHHCVPKKNAPAAVGEVVFSNCFVCAARICTVCTPLCLPYLRIFSNHCKAVTLTFFMVKEMPIPRLHGPQNHGAQPRIQMPPVVYSVHVF